MDADADLEPNLPADHVVDDPANLEATDLAGDDTVFDDRGCTAGFDRRNEREMLGVGGGRRRERLHHGRPELALVDLPHRDRGGERLRPARQQARVAVGEEVESAHLPATGPGQRRTEAASRVVIDQHPGEAVVDQCTSGRERELVRR